MSLLIVGSCSRVTQNIVKLLAQKQNYQNITILDLLPLYSFHQRFYNLQRHLKSTNTSTQVTMNKLFRPQDLAANINSHQDLLFVTHDYFQSVTSKTKLMQLTAKLSQSKNPVFATPLQYDHFGLADPQAQFSQSQQEVLKANPKASFVRADIQDSTEFLAYLHHPKNFVEEAFFRISDSFSPNIVESSTFNNAVVDALGGAHRGESNIIGGTQHSAQTAVYSTQIEAHQTRHHCSNISNIVKKYRCLQSRIQKAA